MIDRSGTSVPFPSMGKGQGRGASTGDAGESLKATNGLSAPASANSSTVVEAPYPQPFPIEGKGEDVLPRGRGDFDHERSAPKVYHRAKRLRQTMTYAERTLWDALRKLKLPIRRQAPIGPYVVDFACHSARLVIEPDGAIHENLPEVAAADFVREEWLKGQGYRVLRLSNKQVLNDLDAIVEQVGAQVRPA